MRKVHERVSTESSRPLWPDQPPGSANHPELVPEKTVLAIVNVRDGIGMERSLTN